VDQTHKLALCEVSTSPISKLIEHAIDREEAPKLGNNDEDRLGDARPRGRIDLNLGRCRVELEDKGSA
jgi:hypothetical protein